MIISVGYI